MDDHLRRGGGVRSKVNDGGNNVTASVKNAAMDVSTVLAKKEQQRETAVISLHSLADSNFVVNGVEAVVVEQIPVGEGAILSQAEIADYSHLRDVSLIELPGEKRVEAIIGADLAYSFIPFDGAIRRGHPSALWAYKTCWGWCVLGRAWRYQDFGLKADTETILY